MADFSSTMKRTIGAVSLVLLLTLGSNVYANSGGLMLTDSNAAVKFGPLMDVNLYRAAADTLQTDNNLIVGGNITAGPSQTNLLLVIQQQAAQITSLLGVISNMILAPTTVFVANSGAQFNSIAAAWAWAQSRVIAAPLTIKVKDGVYNMAPFAFGPIMNAQFITITGNTASPSRVVLKCTQVGGFFYFLSFGAGTDGVTFQGFTLNGTTVGNSFGLATSQRTYVTLNYLVVNNWFEGVRADGFSEIGGQSLVFQNCLYALAIISYSHAYIAAVTITGSQASGIYLVVGSGFYNPATVQISNTQTGVFCDAFSSYTGNAPSFGAGVVTQYNCNNH